MSPNATPTESPTWPGPHFCVWEITLKCNMRCLHCGSYAGSPRQDEMSLEEMLDVADQLALLGVRRLTLSGGEPFLRPDWDKIAQRLIEQGISVGIISNGWHLAANMDKLNALHALKASPPAHNPQGQPGRLEIMAMSFDGLEDKHDAFRQTPGSFQRLRQGYALLKEAGIRTAAITSVSGWNVDHLEEMHELLCQWGVDAWQLQTLFEGGRLRQHPELLTGVEGVEKTAKFIARQRRDNSPINIFPADCIGYCTDLDPFIRNYPWHGCQAGLNAIGIEANGNVKGCLSLCPEMDEANPFVEGNLHQEKLADIWQKPGAFAYNRAFDPSLAQGHCARCSYLRQCRCGCTSQSYFATGSTYENPFCLRAYQAQRRHLPEDYWKTSKIF